MSKNQTDLISEIKTKFKTDVTLQNRQRIWLNSNPNELIDMCKWFKEKGFMHLSAISVTDWLEKKEYELTYHLWSYNEKKLVTIKTRINRKKPVIDSVTPVFYENAQIHERELHELFGVEFKGNSDLTPLFLENWEGPDPFRNDFNWREYVKDSFYNKDDEREKVYYD